MSRFDAKPRQYEKMTARGLRPMSNHEMVEEAKDTIKIGKRKSIHGKETLEAFFDGGSTDQSLCREGLIDLQNGIEMLLKGIIEYYGESYIEEHYTDRNSDILENLIREYPEVYDLHDIFGILTDDDFSFTFYKCSKFPRYSSFRTNRRFRSLAYRVIEHLIRYVDEYIFIDD